MAKHAARPDPALLLYIRNHIEDHGYAPTVREMAAFFDLSNAGLHNRLAGLVHAGLIERVGPRAIRITDHVS